jgi:hypothetical protein
VQRYQLVEHTVLLTLLLPPLVAGVWRPHRPQTQAAALLEPCWGCYCAAAGCWCYNCGLCQLPSAVVSSGAKCVQRSKSASVPILLVSTKTSARRA